MKLSKLIKDYRQLEGITQNELGQMMGCTQRYISLLENDLRKMSLKMLESLEEFLTAEWKPKFRKAFSNQSQEYENIFSDLNAKFIDLSESDMEFIAKLIDALRFKNVITRMV